VKIVDFERVATNRPENITSFISSNMIKSRKRRSSVDLELPHRIHGALEAESIKTRKIIRRNGIIERLFLRETLGGDEVQVEFRSVPTRFQFSFEDVFSRVSGRVADDAIALGWSRNGRRILSYKVDESTELFFLWTFDFFGLTHSSYRVREGREGGIVYTNLPVPLVPSLISPLFPSLRTLEEDDSHTFVDENKQNTRVTYWEAPDGKCIVAVATKRSALKEGSVEFHYSIIPTPLSVSCSTGSKKTSSPTTTSTSKDRSLHFSYTVSAPFPRPSIACFAQLSSAAAQDPTESCAHEQVKDSINKSSVYRLVLNTGNSLRVLTFSVTDYDDNDKISNDDINSNSDSSLFEENDEIKRVDLQGDDIVGGGGLPVNLNRKVQNDSTRKPWFSRVCECVCNLAIPESKFASDDDFILRAVQEKKSLKSLPCSCGCSCNEVPETSPLTCSSSVATRALVESLSPLYISPFTSSSTSSSSSSQCGLKSSVKLLSLSSCSLSTLLPRCVKGSVRNFDARIVQVVDSCYRDEETSKAAISQRTSKESVFIHEDDGGESLAYSIPRTVPNLLESAQDISDLSIFQHASNVRDARHLLITALVDHIIEGPLLLDAPAIATDTTGETQNDILNSSFGTGTSSSSSPFLAVGDNMSASTSSPDGGTQQTPPPPPPPLLPLLPPQVTPFLGPLILGTYASRKQLSRSSTLSSSTFDNTNDDSSLAFDTIVCADEPNQAPPIESISSESLPVESLPVESSSSSSSSWKKKSVWARGVGSSYAVLLPAKPTAPPITPSFPLNTKVTDEFAFNDDERSVENVQKKMSEKVNESVDSYGSSKRVMVVREAAPTRSKITFFLDVLTGDARVLTLMRVPPSLQPGFDNDATSVISSITADLVTKQRSQMYIPPHPSAEPVELNNNAFLAGRSLSRLVNPRLPIAILNRNI